MAIDFKLPSVDSCKAAIVEALDNINEDFLWLEEILIECKNTFSSAKVNLLPKTPSQKKAPKRRARRRITDEELVIIKETESSETSQPSRSSASRTSLRPTLATRSTRSRAAHTAPVTATRTTRSSRTAAKVAEEAKTSLSKGDPPAKEKNVTLVLHSVVSEVSILSPKQSKPGDASDGEKSEVVQKARAYESMLRQQGSSPSTSGSSKEPTPKRRSLRTNICADSPTGHSHKETEVITVSDSECSEEDIVNSSRRSRRCSRQSLVAHGRRSVRVFGSKARLKSMQGHLSVTGPVMQAVEKELETLAFKVAKETEEKKDLNETTKAAVSEHSTTEEMKSLDAQPLHELANSPAHLSAKTKHKQRSLSLSRSSPRGVTKANVEPAPEKRDESPAQSSIRTKRKKQKSVSSGEEAVTAKVAKMDSATSSETIEVEDDKSCVDTTARDTQQTSDEDMDSTEVSATETTVSSTFEEEGQNRSCTRARKAQRPVEEHPVHPNSKKADPSTNSTTQEEEEKTSTRTRARKRQQSSDKETTETTIAKSDTTASSTSEEGRSNTRTRARKAQQNSSVDDSSISASTAASCNLLPGDERQKSSAAAEAEETSRRETRVLTHTDITVQAAVNSSPACSTRTKTRQGQQRRSKESDNVIVTVPEPDKEPRITRTKSRKRQAEAEEVGELLSKRSCMESPSQSAKPAGDEHINGASDAEIISADDDSDYEDIENTEPVIKKQPKPSFLNQLRKNSVSRSTSFISGVVTSFLMRNTPPRKPNVTHMQEQKKKELLQKEKKEQERISRLEAIRKHKADEQKKKREERMKKVADMREMRQKKETDLKKSMAEKLKERLNSTDRMKDERFKEEREKQKMRLKRQLEADERRRQEEEQRLQRLLEQQEEQRLHEELLQRKKELEEQERQRKFAEERKRQEERQAELERQKQVDADRLLQQDLERERERHKEKELK